MSITYNINKNGKIVKSERPDIFTRSEIRNLIYNALNANEYSFEWKEDKHQPYKGNLTDGEKNIELLIYAWNITPTHINEDEHQKGIQISSNVDDEGFNIDNTDDKKVLLLGLYNCSKQPIIAAWDAQHYRGHGQNTCYVDIKELKKGLDNGLFKCFHGCNVYTMTRESLPVYASNLSLNGNNVLELEVAGSVSKSKLRSYTSGTKRNKRYIDKIKRLEQQIENVSVTEKHGIVKQRVGQGLFRDMLLEIRANKCELCEITTTSMLRASHIKAWSKSSDAEKLDANNGLLLCAHHDALFDKHLISFDANGNVIISSLLSADEINSLGISTEDCISMDSSREKYMRVHRQEIK